MDRKDSELDVYYIPPNFIDGGTVMGGLFKLRNTVEAGILALATGIPIFMLNFEVAAKMIVLCFTSLPLALLALIGVYGESLSSYIFGVLKFFFKRRILGKQNVKNEVQYKEKQLFSKYTRIHIMTVGAAF